MNERKPDWYDTARRQGLARLSGEGFTEEMKRTVLRSADGASAYKGKGAGGIRQLLRRAMAAAAIGAAALILVLTLQDGGWRVSDIKDQRAASAGLLGERKIRTSGGEIAVAYGLLEGERLERGDAIMSSSPELLPGLGNSAHPIGSPERNAIETLTYDDITLLDSKSWDGVGTLLRYTINSADLRLPELPADEEYFGFTYDAFTGPERIYSWGMGHSFGFNHETVRLFGQDMLKISAQGHIDGIGITTWYLRKIEDGLETFLTFHYPAMHERDLDGDGVEELIAVSGRGNQIYVFKERNNELYYAGIRELLGAGTGDTVSYDPTTGLFGLSLSGGEESPQTMRTYRYAEGADKLFPL
ncbi:hypothetical protein [Paenibacillus agaridevorans]|uniref:hypothetical protein n=1 Tax=Paenibacillus agaridevorans TaxID=171404 RepID=UPI001BE42E43|nr:hypothetical protein [Paenibacillus agaridevorans]